MTVTIHLIGIPLVLLFGLIVGAFAGFMFGLRAGAKRGEDKPMDQSSPTSLS